MIFICMIFGGVVMGLRGIILSVPFAVLINIFLEQNETPPSDP